jgi:hypothetical protein
VASEKIYNSNTWTQARFNSFIKGGLRQISYRWPPKYLVKKAAWRSRGTYLCAGYRKRSHKVSLSITEKKAKVNNVFVDHIDPVIDPEKGFESWDRVIERMFCETEGLQVLCRACHKEKTSDERKRKL